MVIIDRIIDFVARIVLRDIYMDGFASNEKLIDENVIYNYKSLFPNENVKQEVEMYIKEA